MVEVNAGKLSFGIFLGGLTFFLLGFSTPYWNVSRPIIIELASGLWLVCTRVTVGTGNRQWACNTPNSSPINISAKLKTTQAMMCLALIICAASLALFALWLRKSDNTKYCLLALGSCLAAGVFNLLGVSIYASQYTTGTNLGWSFGLACCSTALFILNGGGFLGLILWNNRNREGYEKIDEKPPET